MRSSAVLVLMLVFIFHGCSLIRVGPGVEILDVDMDENADKNLDAIRAMQADRYRRSESVTSSPATISSKAQETPPVTLNSQLHFVPTTPSSKTDALAKRPWNPSAVPPPGLTERPVPAYTIPAPVGPGQAGSARCVPDGIVGQRCLTH